MHVALLWLINERGEILLSRRASHMTSDAGVWGPSVSGKVEPGEAAHRAAVREAEEELGIAAQTLSAHFLHEDSHDHPDGTLREFSVYYTHVPRRSRDDFVLDPDEVAGTKWVTLDEIRRLLREEPQTILVSNNGALWERLLEQLQPLTGKVKV